MQTVRLEGKLGEKFGEVWEMNITSLSEIFRLIGCQTRGFQQHMIHAAENDIEFAIQQGSDFYGEEDLLLSNNLKEDDIIITQIPAGQKSGFAKIIAAVLIVWLMVISAGGAAGLGSMLGGQGATGGILAGIGSQGIAQFVAWSAMGIALNLAMSGISQLLAPGPETDSRETNEAYLFDGPVNQLKQGVPVPIAYGELVVGGSPMNVSYRSSKFPSGGYNFGAWNHGQNYNGPDTTSDAGKTQTPTPTDTDGDTWPDPTDETVYPHIGHTNDWGLGTWEADDYIETHVANV
jgi:predicted phage tail protein